MRETTAVLLLATALGCATPGRAPEPPAPVTRPPAEGAAPAERVADVPAETSDFTILAVNDVYRIEGVDAGTAGGLARLRTLREELEESGPVLVLHAGDLLFPSLLSQTYGGAQMIDVLNALDGAPGAFDQRMFAVFGNHEFDKTKLADAALLDARVEGSELTWLGTNVDFAEGDDGRTLVAADNLVDTAIVELGGVRVGLFGVTTDMAKPAYVEGFGDPAATARHAVAGLRARGADVVVALTHLEMSEDLAMLTALGADGPDLVVGGHEHDRQCAPEGACRVFKADADARSASVFRVALGPGGTGGSRTGGSRTVRFDHDFRLLDAAVEEDPEVARLVDDWLVRHDAEYCTETLAEPPGCLAEALGTTRTRLLGEELEIRRYETNLGDWIADRALAAYRPHGAQAAVVNAGSLRLNQDVPAGADVTRRHVEELFPYPADLTLLRLDGATLQEVVSRAVEGWTGNGWWLQVAGLAFRHDPETGTASGLTLLAPGGPRPIAPDEELLVVVPDYLAQGNDGYAMLAGAPRVDAPAADLKRLVAGALRAAGEEGIAPEVEGRICNTERPGPCLAVP